MNFFKKVLGITLTVSLFFITGCGNVATTDESPNAVILKMQQRYQEKKSESKTGRTDGLISIVVDSEEMKADGSGNINVAYDGKDTNNPRFDMKLSLKGKANLENFTGSLNLQLAIKMLEKTLYMNLSKLEIESSEDPTIAQQVQMFAPMFANQWFKMPLPENDATNPLALQNPLALGGSSLTDEQIAKIEELTKTIQILEFVEDMGSGNGKYRYLTTLHKENGLKFIEEMTKIVGQEFTEEIRENIKMVLASSDAKMELVIDAATYNLDEINNGEIIINSEAEETMIIKINGKFSDKKTVMSIQISGGEGIGEGNVTISLDLNNNNKTKVEVTAPENAQEFDPLMMMGAGAGI